jgi:hypothetical protein
MLDDVFDQDPRFQTGERRFAVTVHEPTSRSPVSGGGGPARNYDHCVLSADVLEKFIQARRVSTNILTDHAEDPEVRLTSDHFPIVVLFKTRGEGISLDLRRRITALVANKPIANSGLSLDSRGTFRWYACTGRAATRLWLPRLLAVSFTVAPFSTWMEAVVSFIRFAPDLTCEQVPQLWPDRSANRRFPSAAQNISPLMCLGDGCTESA